MHKMAQTNQLSDIILMLDGYMFRDILSPNKWHLVGNGAEGFRDSGEEKLGDVNFRIDGYFGGSVED